MTIKDSSPSPDSHPDPYQEMALDIMREFLRQSRCTATVSVAAIAGSAFISLIGGGLLLVGKITEGSATTAAGIVSSMYCTQAAKDSNEKLEKIARELRVLKLPSEE